MSYDPYGEMSKIDLAKESVRQAVSALVDGDQVGVLLFNDRQQWLVPMTTLNGQETLDRIESSLDAIKADGGTEIYPALNVGFDAMAATDADVRHIVLITDGKSRTGTPESYQLLIEQNRLSRTTLSTIAVGEDADADLLRQLAVWGSGRYHFAETPEEVPAFTLAEAKSAGSQSVIRGAFQPLQTLPSPIMTGFAPEELPALDGYDFARAKPDAQVVLTSTRDDPVLAKWQYGLGRVVAWTADDGADFARGWPEWNRYGEFWSSLVRWALPDPQAGATNVNVQRDGTDALVKLSSIGSDGDYVDLSGATLTITAPSGAVLSGIHPYQSAPGEYSLRIAAPEAGAYRLDLARGGQNGETNELSGFSILPSPELQPSTNGTELLAAIARQSGGRMLSLDETSGLFDATGDQRTETRTYRSVWAWPLGLALLFFLAELGIRFQIRARLTQLLIVRRG
jgi:hypothetical protein